MQAACTDSASAMPARGLHPDQRERTVMGTSLHSFHLITSHFIYTFHSLPAPWTVIAFVARRLSRFTFPFRSPRTSFFLSRLRHRRCNLVRRIMRSAVRVDGLRRRWVLGRLITHISLPSSIHPSFTFTHSSLTFSLTHSFDTLLLTRRRHRRCNLVRRIMRFAVFAVGPGKRWVEGLHHSVTHSPLPFYISHHFIPCFFTH